MRGCLGPTPSQAEAMRIMFNFEQQHGYPISLRELTDARRCEAISGSWFLMLALERKGFAYSTSTDGRRRARSWRLTEAGLAFVKPSTARVVPVTPAECCPRCGSATFAAHPLWLCERSM